MILTEDLEIIIIELPKTVYTIEDEIKNEYNKKLYIWLKFLKYPEGLEEEDMENVNVRKAKEIYQEIEEDEHEQYLAHLREKYILDGNSRESYGFEKGIKKGMKKVAKKLLEEGMDIEKISEITELSRAEIEGL